MNIKEESLKKHYEWHGKLDIVPKMPITSKEELSIAYTPGVAEACLVIQKEPQKSFELTGRGNLVAVITDGTAVLGLGDIGPEAGMPVMEGKCALLKTFGGVDAIPLCIKSKDPQELIRTVALLQGNFGGINLEDISAPRCFEIEEELKKICTIPVFHDDQHGTAIVAGAAIINSLKLVNKKIEDVKIVINGAGAAGVSIAYFLLSLGAKHITMVDSKGIICEGDPNLNPVKQKMAKVTNREHLTGKLADAMKNSDIFIGVSVSKIVSKDMVKSMNKKAIVLALANPVPEITREDALEAGAYIVGTGSSAVPNQINNVLAFPGIFRGALDVRASQINSEMMLAAAYAIANSINKEELHPDYVIPLPFNKVIHELVAQAVSKAAIESKVTNK